MSAIPKVDVHHHVLTDHVKGNAFGLKGMTAPLDWSEEIDEDFSASINVQTRILSVSTPGVSYISDPKESAVVAREMNEYCASLRDKDPISYGFFATVPSLEHTALVLKEIEYAFDTLHADGVTLFTSYATPEGYLGHEEYVPVWEELNRRKAVVFVHPINNVEAKYFNEKLAMPAFDWPHETGRTAIDMILNKRLYQFPDIKVILSHGGGTLAALVKRATLMSLPEFGAHISSEDIIEQAKRFYFDLALTGSEEMLPLILNFARENHILFGSDFPHATVKFSQAMTKFIDGYPMDDERRKEIYHGAAEKLFPRLKGIYKT